MPPTRGRGSSSRKAPRVERAARRVTDRSWMARHQRQAKRLKDKHHEGDPCWWCGEPMYLEQGLDADHSIARAKGGTEADRLLHSTCNRQRGDGTHDHARPALTGKPFSMGKHDRSEWTLLDGW